MAKFKAKHQDLFQYFENGCKLQISMIPKSSVSFQKLSLKIHESRSSCNKVFFPKPKLQTGAFSFTSPRTGSRQLKCLFRFLFKFLNFEIYNDFVLTTVLKSFQLTVSVHVFMPKLTDVYRDVEVWTLYMHSVNTGQCYGRLRPDRDILLWVNN